MVAITTRAGKGSALTNGEVDANFTGLKAAAEGVPAAPRTLPLTAGFTLAQSDAGCDITADHATGVTATVELQATVPITGPYTVILTQLGDGPITVAEAVGVSIEPTGKRKTKGRDQSLGLRWIAVNRWQIVNAKS